jgi:hypothetical protein
VLFPAGAVSCLEEVIETRDGATSGEESGGEESRASGRISRVVCSESPMPQAPSRTAAPVSPGRPAPPLSPWLIAAGSLVIVYHLAAIVVPTLDAPSGPWPTPFGRMVADPPPFAHAASGLSTLHAEYLRVAHSYHFVTNRPGDLPGVQFDVRLKDDRGEYLRDDRGEVIELHFPDPHANPWVRHRQEVLASSLAPDFPIEPQGGEVIAAIGEKVPRVAIWWRADQKFPPDLGAPPPPPPTDHTIKLRLLTVPQHLVPRNMGAMRPSDWSLVLARSYARYQCRAHGAASAEIVRHTREPVSPAVLFGMRPLPNAFDEYVATFDPSALALAEEKTR